MKYSGFNDVTTKYEPGIALRDLSHEERRGTFNAWLAAHNRRRQHHWTQESFDMAMAEEAQEVDRLLRSAISTAGDLAEVILASTAFGEFDLSPEIFDLLDQLVIARKKPQNNQTFILSGPQATDTSRETSD